jgi:hypothetical protein
MDSATIAIVFNQDEQKSLSWVFMEVFGGGSTRIIQKILGDQVESARQLESKIQAQVDSSGDAIELTAVEWRVMYDSLNAMIYGLGPSELHTCAGHSLQSACDLNLKICAALWGARGVGHAWVGN